MTVVKPKLNPKRKGKNAVNLSLNFHKSFARENARQADTSVLPRAEKCSGGKRAHPVRGK